MTDARSDSPAAAAGTGETGPGVGAAADAAAVGLFGRGGGTDLTSATSATVAAGTTGKSLASHVRTRSAPVARAAARAGGGGEERSCSPPSGGGSALGASGGNALDAKKKKLSKSKLMLPLCRERRSSGDLSNGGSSGTDGLRMMSPADERMIDEAIELANQFARTSLHEQDPDAAASASKSRSKFLLKFPLKKSSSQQAERKSFTDGLAMKASAAVAELLTPESQKAYDELVARVGPSSPLPRDTALPFARSNSVAGSSSSCQAAAGRARTAVDAFATLTRPSIHRRSSSPAMTVSSTVVGGLPSPQQQQQTLRRPQQLEQQQLEQEQQTAGETTCPRHYPSAARPILRKSLSAMEHSPFWNAGRASSARPRHPAAAWGGRGAASEIDLSVDVDIDEGIMADDLSDLPSSPPPPVPLAPSTAYVGIGLYNNLDPFWRHEMRLDFEADEELTNMQGRYKTRSEDNVSYEELLEFAPVITHHDRDVVRVMQKVLGREVPESECRRALDETRGDVLNAIKFVKLMQLWRQLQSDGFHVGATMGQCKDALMYCNWDVGLAARHVSVNCSPVDARDATAEWRYGSSGTTGSSRPAAAATASSRPVSRRTLSCPLTAWSGT